LKPEGYRDDEKETDEQLEAEVRANNQDAEMEALGYGLHSVPSGAGGREGTSNPADEKITIHFEDFEGGSWCLTSDRGLFAGGDTFNEAWELARQALDPANEIPTAEPSPNPCPSCDCEGDEVCTPVSVPDREQTGWFHEGQWWVKDRHVQLAGPGHVILNEIGTPNARLIEAPELHNSPCWLLRPAATFDCSDGVTRVESGEVREARAGDWIEKIGPQRTSTSEAVQLRPGFSLTTPSERMILVPVSEEGDNE